MTTLKFTNFFATDSKLWIPNASNQKHDVPKRAKFNKWTLMYTITYIEIDLYYVALHIVLDTVYGSLSCHLRMATITG